MSKNQAKVDALFFSSRPLRNKGNVGEYSFWECLTVEERTNWGVMLLRRYSDRPLIDKNKFAEQLKWRKSAWREVAVWIYREANAQWMFKFFAAKREGACRHEEALLNTAPRNFPAPKLLGTANYKNNRCALYKLPPGKLVSQQRYVEASLQIKKQLLEIDVPDPLIQQFRRSHVSLSDRMSFVWLDCLKVAALHQGHIETIKYLERNWDRWKQLLASLPVIFFNPVVNRESLWRSKVDGSIVLLNWERWFLEPAGAGWPITDSALTKLVNSYTDACEARETLRQFSVEDLIISALTFELEKQIQKEDLDSALKIAARIHFDD